VVQPKIGKAHPNPWSYDRDWSRLARTRRQGSAPISRRSPASSKAMLHRRAAPDGLKHPGSRHSYGTTSLLRRYSPTRAPSGTSRRAMVLSIRREPAEWGPTFWETNARQSPPRNRTSRDRGRPGSWPTGVVRIALKPGLASGRAAVRILPRSIAPRLWRQQAAASPIGIGRRRFRKLPREGLGPRPCKPNWCPNFPVASKTMARYSRIAIRELVSLSAKFQNRSATFATGSSLGGVGHRRSNGAEGTNDSRDSPTRRTYRILPELAATWIQLRRPRLIIETNSRNGSGLRARGRGTRL